MKVYLTNLQPITSKKGDEYVKYDGLTSEGRSVEVFLAKSQSDEFGLSAKNLVPQKDLVEFLEDYTPVDVYYDQRGRIDTVETNEEDED